MAGPTPRQPRKEKNKIAPITDFFQTRKRSRFIPESEEEDELKAKGVLTKTTQQMKKPKTIDSSTSLGDFKRVPPELRVLLFEKIPAESLAAMANSSRQLHSEISDYVFQSKVGQKRFQLECRVQEQGFVCRPCGKLHTRAQPSENFVSWGVLLKATTCVYPTRKRIMMIQEFFDATTKTAELTSNAQLVRGWGNLFMKVVGNWGFVECERVFHAVMAHDDHRAANVIRAVLDAQPGQMAEEEFVVRMLLRNLFLDHEFTDAKDYPFYLSQILHPFPVAQQAKLLFLLYAPANQNRIQFRSLCDMAVTSTRDRTQRLGPFAQCILALHSKHCSYRKDDIFSLIEELTTFPDPWALDNFSGLLLLMPEIASDTMRARVFCGHVEESADILNAMKTLAFRWGMQSTIDTLMRQLREAIQSTPWTPAVKRSAAQRMSRFIGTAHQERLDDIVATNANRAQFELETELLSYRHVMLKWREIFAKDSL